MPLTLAQLDSLLGLAESYRETLTSVRKSVIAACSDMEQAQDIGQAQAIARTLYTIATTASEIDATPLIALRAELGLRIPAARRRRARYARKHQGNNLTPNDLD